MEFPNGYDTDVGSNGTSMSGGQKQRIAIARALIKKPAVLLLDEATSALDASSEKVVQQSIDALQSMKAQTTIVIAHRLSTIRNADRICLISAGKIEEMGTHDELIAKNGLYADLVRLQMTSDDTEGENVESTSEVITDAKSDALTVVTKSRSPSKAPQIDEKESAVAKADDAKVEDLSADDAKRVRSQIWKRTNEHWGWLLASILAAAVFGAIFPCWGYMLARTQGMFYFNSAEKIRKRAAFLSEMYIVLAVGALVSATLQFYAIAQVGERVSGKIRSEMFEAIMRREIAFFDDEKNSVGALTTRLADDSRIVTKAFGESLARQIQAVFTLLIGLGLAFSASWKVAFVVLACFPISIAASAIQMEAIAGKQYDQTDSNEKDGNGSGGGGIVSGGHGSVISSAFVHMRTVSAFSMQHKVSEHYTKLTNEITAIRIGRALKGGIGFGLGQGSLFLIYSLLFWYGSTLVKEQSISFVDMMTSILTLMLGALGLGTALSDMGDQKEGLQAANRIFKSLEDGQKSSIDGLSKMGEIPNERARGRIELKSVNFRYPTRQDVEVCKSFSLVIEPGQMVALVGPSGSGKSTLINLLLRFYDPLSGEVLLDGRNIKDLNVRWLRSQIGYVGQEPVLFAGSIAENVAKGRANMIESELVGLNQAERNFKEGACNCLTVCGDCCGTTHERVNTGEKDVEMGKIYQPNGEEAKRDDSDDVIEACIASNAHEFISGFTRGYSTDVGESSMMVSGGQKQRIAIARALIKIPAVLLLDEATSALDAASERVVQQSIDALQSQRMQTTIVIAHRLVTIRNADKIVVVDKGSIVEMGTHDELLAKQGLYSVLWNKQNTSADTPVNSPKKQSKASSDNLPINV